MLDPGAQDALADAAAVIDAAVAGTSLEPLVGPGGDREPVLVRMRELNAGLAELALAKRASADPEPPKVPTGVEMGMANVQLAARRGEVAHLVGVCGLSDVGLDIHGIADHAHALGISSRVALHAAAVREGIIIEGLFGRSG
jgi:hypothetical protein